jgi:3-phosphoshikimate 1-carboxyvinyltransferase
MTDSIEIQPAGPIHGSIRPPGSKSITNRALPCAALAAGVSTLRGALDSEDTRVMIDCLSKLGIRVESEAEGTLLRVHGCGGKIPASAADLFVANSGTTIRFLTALVTLGHGTYRLDGIPRMRERPIGDLIEALGQLGADVRSEMNNGCPPVIVEARGLHGATTRVRGDISSQYLSGLLLAAPYASSGFDIVVDGTLVSQPYVLMTLAVMRSFGVVVASDGLTCFQIPAPRKYHGCDYAIEPDASAASYFWAAAAITGGRVTVDGLARHALQGDVAFCNCLAQMGCEVEYDKRATTVTGGKLRGVNVDMNAISDTVQTLAAVALFAEGPTTITGVRHIRHKETDRIGDLARELRKFGAIVDELPDGLRISPPAVPQPATIDTYHDHRMAMSLALVGLNVPGVIINDPACTAKTYPRYFDDLARIAHGQ